MTDYAQEKEMEIEALQAILMDEFEEIDASDSGLNTSNRCFQITISPQEEDEEVTSQVQLALVFAHTEKYPDEAPLLHVKRYAYELGLRGISLELLRTLKQKLDEEASENLGMAMIYTLISSAKEWLDETFRQVVVEETVEATKDDVIIPHGDAVTVQTFVAWRERFEAELALERAKLMPESALATPKEKKLSGREWFERKGASQIADESEDEDDEDIDFDEEDFEDDEEDMLKHYLDESDVFSHSQRRSD